MLRGSVRGSVRGVRGLGYGISPLSRKANERQLATLGHRRLRRRYLQNQSRTLRELCTSSPDLQEASSGTPFILADIGEGRFCAASSDDIETKEDLNLGLL